MRLRPSCRVASGQCRFDFFIATTISLKSDITSNGPGVSDIVSLAAILSRAGRSKPVAATPSDGPVVGGALGTASMLLIVKLTLRGLSVALITFMVPEAYMSMPSMIPVL